MALIISSFKISGPNLHVSMSTSSSGSQGGWSGFSSLAYSFSMYSLHLSLISSGSVNRFLSLLYKLSCFLPPRFPWQSSLTFAYSRSDLPFLSSSSSSQHCLSHHSAHALSVSLHSSLFTFPYTALPSSVFMFFHFHLSSILSTVCSVTQGFLDSFLVYIQHFSLRSL